MARPVKKGLDFFPLDVAIDDNLELLEAECGLEGFAIVIKLWQKIYSNSYFIEWKDDNALLFSKKINSELTTVNTVINTSLRRGLFDESLFNSHKILTSRGIQKRYKRICGDAKRANSDISRDHDLINKELTPEETPVNPEETPEKPQLIPEFSTQSKVKESKEEDTNNLPAEPFQDSPINSLFEIKTLKGGGIKKSYHPDLLAEQIETTKWFNGLILQPKGSNENYIKCFEWYCLKMDDTKLEEWERKYTELSRLDIAMKVKELIGWVKQNPSKRKNDINLFLMKCINQLQTKRKNGYTG